MKLSEIANEEKIRWCAMPCNDYGPTVLITPIQLSDGFHVWGDPGLTDNTKTYDVEFDETRKKEKFLKSDGFKDEMFIICFIQEDDVPGEDDEVVTVDYATLLGRMEDNIDISSKRYEYFETFEAAVEWGEKLMISLEEKVLECIKKKKEAMKILGFDDDFLDEEGLIKGKTYREKENKINEIIYDVFMSNDKYRNNFMDKYLEGADNL